MSRSYEYTCLYCDNKWVVNWRIASPACSKCDDKNLKVKIIEKGKTHNVFGYDEDSSEEEDDKDPVERFNDTIKWGAD